MSKKSSMGLTGRMVLVIVLGTVACSVVMPASEVKGAVYSLAGKCPSDHCERESGKAMHLAAQAKTPERLPVKAEVWWRIHLYELDHGRWRSAGTFENPDRGRCIRYGEAWKEGKPGYRTYTGPVAFQR